MPFLFPQGKVLFFVHVPKTGGSSVEDYLARRFGALALVDRHKRERVRGTGLISPITHLSALDLEEVVPETCDLCFALVRDPMKRILSEYRWQSGASFSSRMGFSSWLRMMLEAARLEPRIHGNHIRPQDEMVPRGAEIFHLEEGFDAMVARLDEVTGTTAPNLRVGHLKNRQKTAVPIHVTREDAALIAGFYAADYARFGYDRPDPTAFDSDPAARWRERLTAPLARMLVAKQRREWVR